MKALKILVYAFAVIYGATACQKKENQSQSNGEELVDELAIIDSLQAIQYVLDTVVTEAEAKLIGSWIYGVQFMDEYGQANIYKSNGVLEMEGYQYAPVGDAYCRMQGSINVIDDTKFVFNGLLELYTDGCCGPIEWFGDLTFYKKGDRKYYRMKEFDQLCSQYTCAYYLDLVDKVNDVPNLELGETYEDEEGVADEGMIMIQEIDEGQLEVLFHGYGTEPYWDVYVTEKRILVRDLNMDGIVLTVDQVFDQTLEEQTITFNMADGIKGSLLVKKEPADDGMSDFNFPYSANYNGQPGCGDINAMNDISIYMDYVDD